MDRRRHVVMDSPPPTEFHPWSSWYVSSWEGTWEFSEQNPCISLLYFVEQ